jgi:competence protein ComEC
MQHGPWRSGERLARFAFVLEQFLGRAGFDRAPWLAVGLAAGVTAWFGLPLRAYWLGWIGGALAVAVLSTWTMARDGRFPFLRQAFISMGMVLALGCALPWVKSELTGTRPIAQPLTGQFRGLVLERQAQPAQDRVRFLLLIRPAEKEAAIRVRVSVKAGYDAQGAVEGAVVRAKLRLMPPSPPMVPGGYDAARAAWFGGLAATGSAYGPLEVEQPAPAMTGLAALRHRLADHVRASVGGSAGGMAAAFASGDRGGIAPADEDAMRDSGLTHLLSVSGLHVSAVVGGAYWLAMRLLGLWPWLVLRVRLPLLASGCGGAVAVFYTALTGAEVPTLRSCIGALLVLAAVALGRQPLSLRLLAMAAVAVMLLWPEAVVGPSFQMSFGSVLAIIALHEAAPVRAFLSAREEPVWQRWLRQGAMLLLTGVVIELALMPASLFHFHRAGLYGALANLVAIPLTTVVTMPLIALALLLDAFGWGAPAWWLCGQSLDALLALARCVAGQAGAVSMLPAMSGLAYAACVAGLLWLALWHGRVRLLGLVPALAAMLSLAFVTPPDVLISADGRDVGLVEQGGRQLVMLRYRPPQKDRADFATSAMAENLGLDPLAPGVVVPLAAWPGAQCNDAFCRVGVQRAGRTYWLLLARGKAMGDSAAMQAACAAADVVVVQGRIDGECHPRLLRADETMLYRSGGLALDLADGHLQAVGWQLGQHPWWRRPTWRGEGIMPSR